MKYYVIAKHWDSEKQAQVEQIVGEFTKYFYAALFAEAYNNEFSSHAVAVNETELLNGLHG